MKVFCYFVEPALYTLDLAKNIYVKNNIDYGFINSSTLVKSGWIGAYSWFNINGTHDNLDLFIK